MNKRYSTSFKIQFSGVTGQRKRVAGVDYAVYPSIILVEGVHHGAIGAPTMYPVDVLASSAPMWNNIPVTVHHPQDQEGAYVSAGSPEVLQAWAVGKLLNARHEEGKLKADVMIDLKKATAKHPTLINDLDRGVEMQVSTGLYGEEVVEEGLWNNEAYASRLTAIQPDHLALLPGAEGACSWADGCGIRANKENGMKVNGDFTKKDMGGNSGPDRAAILIENVASHGQISLQLQSYLDTMDIPRMADNSPYKFCYIQEVFDNYFVYEEDSQSGSKYWRQSYSINADDKVVVSDDKTQVQKRVEYVPVTTNANKENTMADKNKKCCPDRVASLIANAATTYTAEDSEWLSALTETQLEKLEAPYKANAAGETPAGMMKKSDCATMKKANGEAEGDAAPDKTNAAPADQETPEQKWEAFMNSAPAEFRAVINAGTRALDAKRTDLIGKIKANAKNTFTDDELKGMPDVVLEKMAGMATPEPAKHDYSGRGGAFQTNSPADEEEAYVPVTINFAKDKGEAGK